MSFLRDPANKMFLRCTFYTALSLLVLSIAFCVITWYGCSQPTRYIDNIVERKVVPNIAFGVNIGWDNPVGIDSAEIFTFGNVANLDSITYAPAYPVVRIYKGKGHLDSMKVDGQFYGHIGKGNGINIFDGITAITDTLYAKRMQQHSVRSPLMYVDPTVGYYWTYAFVIGDTTVFESAAKLLPKQQDRSVVTSDYRHTGTASGKVPS